MISPIKLDKLLILNAILRQRKKKLPISVTVAGEVIEGMNLIVPAKQRSKFVAVALRRELRRRMRRARTAHDLAVLDARADRLDRETDDLIDLQADPFA